MCSLREGQTVEIHEKNRQNDETKPNWISVRVAGLGKELRIDFEEVLVKALEKYQTRQSAYKTSAWNGIAEGEYEQLI